MTVADSIQELVKNRILLLDGAMGTMLQRLPLDDADAVFDTYPAARGCNEILNLTRFDVIHDIHLAYLKAGADIIETNTFGANRFSLAEYQVSALAYDLNLAGAEVARSAADQFMQAHPGRSAFVAGVIGPTGKSASFSPSVDDPAYRDVLFSDFVEAFEEQIDGLLDGGADLLLIETVFDTLVAKAALVASFKSMERKRREVPVMVSATFSDRSGRTLSGQTLEAFVDSISAFPVFSIGLNCSTGPQEMIPLIERLSQISPVYTSAHPNAGFPDREGRYGQSPEQLASLMKPVLEQRLLNIVGGCCGTTPEHIAALSKVVQGSSPGKLPSKVPQLRLSGLESLKQKAGDLIVIGERTNVAGSRKFARLIREGSYEEALSIARSQIEQGAHIIDICMDDAMIDAQNAMVRFIRLASADPEIARVPFMIDSSDWPVITSALQELQGRGIVNSISLKEGPGLFIERARHIVSMGAAMVVMLFDEQGQADTFERKIEVARRSYDLLVGGGVCDPSSIIFDPNVLAIATGMDAHDRYAIDFIRAVAWIKANLPGAFISGGISNLSFSFRGNNSLRDAMHAVFLAYAVDSGLDMAIINPGTMVDASTLPQYLVSVLEQVLLAKGEHPAADREALVELAMQPLEIQPNQRKSSFPADTRWRAFEVQKRLSHALLIGEDSYLAEDLQEAADMDAVAIIEGPLMDGMAHVGKLFGEGKLFLPQVVRSARVMKHAVDILQPRLESASASASRTAGTIILATVKGDVHDIGKNIVALVLRCNNFTVIDLGVMVPPEQILEAARKHHADLVGLSGLITPSLREMGTICSMFQAQGMEIPVMVGGATTSEEHTAMKLEILYPGKVFHSTDASDAASVALALLSRDSENFIRERLARYASYREDHGKPRPLLPFADAASRSFTKEKPAPIPASPGIHVFEGIPVDTLKPLVNWPMICRQWRVPLGSEEADRLIDDAKAMLEEIDTANLFKDSIKAVVGLYRADVQDKQVVRLFDGRSFLEEFRFLRSQTPGTDGLCRSLADYIHPGGTDTIGLFVATSGLGVKERVLQYREKGDEYHALLLQTIADRLAEALSAYLQQQLSCSLWGFGSTGSIRPAVGYPSAPDHAQKKTIFSLLDVSERIGVRLTEGYAMDPVSSVCGFYFVGDGCTYFSLGTLGNDQLADYALWRHLAIEELDQTLATGKE